MYSEMDVDNIVTACNDIGWQGHDGTDKYRRYRKHIVKLQVTETLPCHASCAA